jgi:ferritin-like metal-binding protein YciE
MERLGEKPSAAKNLLSACAAENLEIAAYRALIAAAPAVGDEETAGVCEEILRDEKRMAAWLMENLPWVVRETLSRTEWRRTIRGAGSKGLWECVVLSCYVGMICAR